MDEKNRSTVPPIEKGVCFIAHTKLYGSQFMLVFKIYIAKREKIICLLALEFKFTCMLTDKASESHRKLSLGTPVFGHCCN